jgi:hypothetical protein
MHNECCFIAKYDADGFCFDVRRYDGTPQQAAASMPQLRHQERVTPDRGVEMAWVGPRGVLTEIL